MPEEPRGYGRDIIRTMKTDLEEAGLQKSRVDVAKFIAQREPSPRSKVVARSLVIILAGLLFLGVAGGLLYYMYISRAYTEPPVKKLEIPRSFLPTEHIDAIRVKKGDRTGLISLLRDRETQHKDSAYTYIPFTVGDFSEEPTLGTPEDFFSILRISPPEDFLGSLSSRWNIYVTSGHVVFIFETGDWLKANGNMLHWEDSIAHDFAVIAMDDLGTASKNSFTDLLVKNNPARFLPAGTDTDAGIGYAFVQQRFLVVTTSQSSLRETIERMVAGSIIY